MNHDELNWDDDYDLGLLDLDDDEFDEDDVFWLDDELDILDELEYEAGDFWWNEELC